MLASGEGEETIWFADVGALVWYLMAVPWVVPGFAASDHLSRLRDLHGRLQHDGPAAARLQVFFLEARKPAAGD